MNRYIPLVVLLVLIGAFSIIYGPGIYRGLQFKRASSEMLRELKAGRLSAAIGYIEPAQQAGVSALTQRLPADYQQHIASLKLTHWERADRETIWAVVTLRLQDDAGSGLYQGKLRWQYSQGRWWIDFSRSYGAPATLSGEPEWRELVDLLELIRHI